MKTTEIREYQVDFEKFRTSINSEYKELFRLVNNFKKDYPLEKIKILKLDDYVSGKGDPTTFCNRIENELNEWGNIHGSTAKKFGIYYGVDGDDKEKKYRVGKSTFGSSSDKAFKSIKSSIIELIKNEDDYEILKKNPISPMFKGKILSIYHFEKFLNIFSASHLNYFINTLSLENTSSSEIDKQKKLLNFKNNDPLMKNWSIFEFSKFLYHSFGKPNDEMKEKQVPKELKKFIQKDFPPIEKIKVEYVDLQTDKLVESGKKLLNRIPKKIDYLAQSKEFQRTGDRGEQIAVMEERQRLIKNSRPDLAKKVEQVSRSDDSLGYDIKSYDDSGKEKYIEVKSTLSSFDFCNIYISENELNVSKSKDNYFFYIVYDAGSKAPKIWKIKSTDFFSDENIEPKPILFRIGIKIK
ncbi:MAG: Unknown protein [uncultured Sulfurovum sp.]|uniref:Protein NO VEIN C-terminal domain-containing protein n=1 Tax=uncultured Sulfurovum sp. TaxID=269237 RepID=A0A6S6UBF1_9BACT|nr:MAG: Unknown protein [uncultured Sulfurovum sp.]